MDPHRLPRLLLLFVVFALVPLLGACASNAKSVRLHPSQLGGVYARQAGYFAACGTMCMEEETRGGIPHEVIRDEVTFSLVDANQTCFEAVIRAEGAVDEPLEEVATSCTIDGQAQRVVVLSQEVSVKDYDYQGRIDTLRVEGVTATEYLGISLSEPADLIFRVIERRGRVCCAAPTRQKAHLVFHNRHLDVGMSRSLLDFKWTLAP